MSCLQRPHRLRALAGAWVIGVGADAAVLILSMMAANLVIAPVALRAALTRSGEAGQKQATDFAPHGARA